MLYFLFLVRNIDYPSIPKYRAFTLINTGIDEVILRNISLFPSQKIINWY